MSDLSQFERAVQAKLLAAERRRKLHRDQIQRRTDELLRRSRQFGQTADHLLHSVIRPRVEKVTACLGKGELLPANAVGRYQCISRFEPAGRFPSTTRLGMAVSHDSQFERLLLLYDLEILPVPFRFEGKDEQHLPQHAVDEQRVIAWVDERLLQFVDTYLYLKHGDLPDEGTSAAVSRFAA